MIWELKPCYCDYFIPYFQFTQKYKVILSSLHVDVGEVSKSTEHFWSFAAKQSCSFLLSKVFLNGTELRAHSEDGDVDVLPVRSGANALSLAA